MAASEVRNKTYNTGHKGDENRKNIQCGRIQSEKGRGEGVKTGKTSSMAATEVRNKTYSTGHASEGRNKTLAASEVRNKTYNTGHKARRDVARG